MLEAKEFEALLPIHIEIDGPRAHDMNRYYGVLGRARSIKGNRISVAIFITENEYLDGGHAAIAEAAAKVIKRMLDRGPELLDSRESTEEEKNTEFLGDVGVNRGH
uniref:Uncharacterized protein n=1 Tax=viral metagenome TaxID=1070528 RepID=A0A6M3IQU6_9ZZZZ